MTDAATAESAWTILLKRAEADLTAAEFADLKARVLLRATRRSISAEKARLEGC